MDDIQTRYNYDSFVPEKFEQWLNFDASPKVGALAPEFPLWQLDQTPVSLHTIVAQHQYTMIEFGSFT
ncbi:MAG: hypothetical protein HY781_09715 [Chloroflexi bacterium]|nr:hypothetical protein [Chloroflexota bacterium]